ncbi:hypothetical protein K7432_012720 [Basidiobolus ranarum]|uniref:SnoaL-like domain-containing protein n=1 Tax=Basidiobolus ranarum TaxID=34480 RepID=A0ABR2VRU8_9FUNG
MSFLQVSDQKALEQDKMKNCLQEYVDGLNACEPTRILQLFADDAVVHDPVGNEPLTDRQQITGFFENAGKTVKSVSIISPITGSFAKSAAMTIKIELNNGETITSIDVMEFNDQYKITTMKAYWGSSDLRK